MGVIRKIQFQLIQGQIPNKELLDGGLILIAGVLMLTPGFITDVFGLLLFPIDPANNSSPIFQKNCQSTI